MRTSLVVGALTIAFLVGCGKPSGPSQPATNPGVVLKVSVVGGGTILVDGKPVRFNELSTRVTDFESQHGVVWLYWDGNKTAQRQYSNVSGLIWEHHLPLKTATKPDFSDIQP